MLTKGDEKVSATILMVTGMSHTAVSFGQVHEHAVFSIWITSVLIQLQSVDIQSAQD